MNPFRGVIYGSDAYAVLEIFVGVEIGARFKIAFHHLNRLHNAVEPKYDNAFFIGVVSNDVPAVAVFL